MAENSHHGSSIGSESTSIEIERKLHQTPTWAVAGVCAVIILISFILEKGLQRIGTVSFNCFFWMKIHSFYTGYLL